MTGAPLIYLMHSTSAPLDPRVREKMLPLLDEDPRRPGGLLSDGRRIRRLLEEARAQVAALCGATAGEIIFTSSGTEACNLALKGVALARRGRRGRRLRAGRMLVAATEHSAVLYPARSLAKMGFDCREIPVDRHGVVRLDVLERMCDEETFLVSVAPATAETGSLQPIGEIARLVKRRPALLHADASLAGACMAIDVASLGADLVSFSAHKMGGPRGVGALYVRDGVRLTPLIEGGVSEGGRRGGAEYVAGIAGFAETATILSRELPSVGPWLSSLAASLQDALLRVPGVSLNGHPERRLRTMVNVSVDGVDGEALVMRLAGEGVAASTGSACFSEAGKPSHVLAAMGLSQERARGSVLFALGRGNTPEEIDRVAGIFPRVVASLRAIGMGTTR